MSECSFCGSQDFFETADGIEHCVVCGTPHMTNLFADVRPPSVSLPTSRAERKDTPIYSGFMKYFPLAMVAVSQLSKSANEVHNPGQPLHWSKGKSNDHRDCLGRHMLELDEYDVEADHDYHYLHAVKAFWRAGAILQEILETGKPARIKKGEL